MQGGSPTADAGTPPEPQGPARQIAAAILGARDAKDLSENLTRLHAEGVDTQIDSLFRALAEGVPDWVSLPRPGDSLTTGGSAGAILRIIKLSGDPADGASRYKDLLSVGIEFVNKGALGRGVALLALAQRAGMAGGLDETTVLLARSTAHQELDPERLKKELERPERRALLKQLFSFFPPLSAQGILKTLRTEQKRDARRLLLALVEVHGAEARTAALERLQTAALSGGDSSWYFERNLVYLLRRLPTPEERDLDAEIACLDMLTDVRRRASLIKEALANLGAIRHEKAERVLVGRLRLYEKQLVQPPDRPSQTPEDLKQIIDRTLAALERLGTPGALKAIADHALRDALEPALGDTLPALSRLSGHDLTVVPGLVDKLTKLLRAKLPMKVLGLSLKVHHEELVPIIEALSDTPEPRVRELLQEVARKLSGTPSGQAAEKALAGIGSPRPEAAEAGAAGGNLSGEVEEFGLPSLLQSLEELRPTGTLLLRSRSGQPLAWMSLVDGRLADCRAGRLQGPDALYQLLERPEAATYALTRQPASTDPLPTPSREVSPLVKEGIARHEALARARAIVGDGAHFRATGVRPSPLPEEEDGNVLRGVWTRASTGASPQEVEAAVEADAYRVRRLYVHWLKEGALTPK